MLNSMAPLFESDTFFLLVEWWTKSSLILALAFLTTWCARKMSASTRSIMWLSAIFTLILLPVVIWLGPNYSVAVDLPASDQTPAPMMTAPRLATHAVSDSLTLPTTGDGIAPANTLLPMPTSAHQSAGQAIQVPVHSLLLSIWLVGMAAVLLWLARGHLFIHRVLRESQPIDDPHILDSARRIGEHYGLKRPVAVCASSRIKIPLVCGLLRATVLLPETAWRTWSDERKDMVLLHELAHVTRRDVLMRALAHALLPFHWFNPLLWVAINRLSWEQERACDDLVLGAGAKPSVYAKTLLTFAQNGRGPLLMSATQLTGTTVKNRILSVLNPDLPRRPIRRLGALAIFSSGLIFGLPFAITSVIAADRHDRTSDSIAVEVQREWNSDHEKDEEPIESLSAEELASALADLRSDDAIVVTKAAILLRQASAPESIPRLVEILGDDRMVLDKWLKPHFSRFNSPTTPGREAAVTLAKMGPEAHEQLMRAVGHAQLVVRANAAFGLGLARNTEAIPLLLDTLTDSKARVRAEAAWSLGMIRDSVAVPGLTNALTDEDGKVREQTAWSLGMIRDEAPVAGLSRAMGDERAEVRRQVAWALGMIRDDDAVDALIDGLADVDGQVRSQTAWALGMIRDDRAVSFLVDTLDDRNADAGRQAAWALGMIRSEKAVSGLASALSNADGELRSQAAWALGMIRSPKGSEALSAALKDANHEVRKQAAWALGMTRHVSDTAGLITVLNDDHPEVRTQAAWALGMIRGDAAVPGLTRALNDPSDDVRTQSAWALGMIRGADAIDGLIDSLEDRQSEVRTQAAWALGMIRDQRAITALKKASQDEASSVRDQAAWALDMIGMTRGREL